MSHETAQPAHQAADPSRSAWVGANAGSGKTYILVTRLVRLMLAGVAPGKIAVPDLYAQRRRRNERTPVHPIG